MVYGYARVSSLGQDKYGNSKQGQTEALKAAGCEKVYYDHFTGTKMDRPEFNKLMEVLKPGDTLKVTKLDRFARTASDGAIKIKELFERGIITKDDSYSDIEYANINIPAKCENREQNVAGYKTYDINLFFAYVPVNGVLTHLEKDSAFYLNP